MQASVIITLLSVECALQPYANKTAFISSEKSIVWLSKCTCMQTHMQNDGANQKGSTSEVLCFIGKRSILFRNSGLMVIITVGVNMSHILYFWDDQNICKLRQEFMTPGDQKTPVQLKAYYFHISYDR